jgi:phosphoesterase RecJ-like protein
MARATLDAERRVVSAWIGEADLVSSGIDWGDTENLIDLLRLAVEADTAVLAKAHDDGRVKVSLRSRGDTDVGALAASFGGGGHRLAAGFTVDDGDVDAVLQSVLDSVESHR